MSLLLVYFDSGRAVVCSDDRAVRFNAAGPEVAAERPPKFIRAGRFIVGGCGRSDIVTPLLEGTARMLAANSAMTLRETSGAFQSALRDLWSRRRQRDENSPPVIDAVGTAVLGVNESGNVQCSLFFGEVGFREIALIPKNGRDRRTIALGSRRDDQQWLESLNKRMVKAGSVRFPWIAAELRDALLELHRKRPVEIGEPSFYAALDTHGWTELPEEFPRETALPSLAACHYIFYDDPAWLGGSVVFQATTTKEVALNGAGRFFIGSIQTPRAGAPDTIGNNDGGSGAQIGQLNILGFIVDPSTSHSGNATITNQARAIDGDQTTNASLSLTANGTGTNHATLALSTPPGIQRRYSAITLKVLVRCLTNTLNGGNGGNVVISWLFNVVGGASGTILNLAGGQTQALTIKTANIPTNLNLATLLVQCNVSDFGSDTSGSLTLDIFEVWLEAIE